MNEFLDVNTLKIDHSYQRQPNMRRVTKLVKEFDPLAFEPITVSRRDDGDYVVEGQHRWLVAQVRGEDKIESRVKIGLTVAEEAALFHAINTGRKQPTPYETYRAGVAAHKQPYLDLEKGLQDRYLGFGQSASLNRITCISTLLNVTRLGGTQSALRAIDLAVAAWGRDPASYAGGLLGGIGQFLAQARVQRKNVDLERVEQILAARPPIGWMQLIVKNTSSYAKSSGSQPTIMARLIAEKYNARRSPKTRVVIK